VRAPVQRPDELEHAFEIMQREQARGVLVLGDQLIFVQGHRINDLARHSRLPTVWTSREGVAAGGLMSYGPSVPDLYRRAATYVDKILKGAKPADLPVEQPTKLELVINMRTARALGLTSGKEGLVAETLGAEVEEYAFHETKKPGERHADTTSIHGCCVMRHLRSGRGVHGHRSGGPSRTSRSDGRRYAKDLVAVGWSGGGL
jgi:hypothetical protein